MSIVYSAYMFCLSFRYRNSQNIMIINSKGVFAVKSIAILKKTSPQSPVALRACCIIFLAVFLFNDYNRRDTRADEEAVKVEDTLRWHKEILLAFAKKQPNMTIYATYENIVAGNSIYAQPQMLKLLAESETDGNATSVKFELQVIQI